MATRTARLLMKRISGDLSESFGFCANENKENRLRVFVMIKTNDRALIPSLKNHAFSNMQIAGCFTVSY